MDKYEFWARKMSEHDFLDEVPVEFRDYNLCLLAVKISGSNLKFVPDELKDYEICRIAASQNVAYYEYLPKTLRRKVVFDIELSWWRENIIKMIIVKRIVFG